MTSNILNKWLAASSCLLMASACQADKETSSSQSQQKPNIVFIFADDLGYGDVSCYNDLSDKVHTPYMDSLASEGIRFTNAHTSSSVSTPSRYSFLTGEYAWRTRLKEGVLYGFSKPLIDTAKTTLPEMLQANGYYTGMVGKWHLGVGWQAKDETKPVFPMDDIPRKLTKEQLENVALDKPVHGGPEDHGFDEAYWWAASLDMDPDVYIENTIPLEAKIVEKGNKAFIQSSFYEKKKEVMPILLDRAEKFILESAKSDDPYFLYFPLTAPHTPYAPVDEVIGSSQAGIYGDFVVQVDQTVGRIMKAVEETGEIENTIFIVSSDNGGMTKRLKSKELVDGKWKKEFTSIIETHGHYTNAHLNGQKTDLFEGGHRVPFILRWPSSVGKNQVADQTVAITDLMATFADIVGYKLNNEDSPDGTSFYEVIKDPSNAEETKDYIVYHSNDGDFAIQKDYWKLIDCDGSGGWTKTETSGAQLYNIKADIQEQNNLADQYPEKVAELKNLLEKVKLEPI
ncbi:sulfatase family protein [Aureibacter tunicatorum]|uniref:Arylsulfatase A-like enzyme n=1 Tax=Aureibacter tunicatorum TaxID=866807 RepID=A0AAE3XTU0_9BACT|nr:arylsulfatase [Aureibacter tunicatorum]MDR6241756.1 arylsulfatase A-like enzyme [Aureibacter tunicatorum]BDD07383.1 arylsulfatase [Aureibacter tunicatorum]